MNRFKMNVVNCAMLGDFVCAMPKQPGERIPAAGTASAHRALAWFDSLPFFQNKNSIPMGCCFVLEQGTGIEPASVAWEATILPMN